MSLCPRCQTMNPTSERACLACGASLAPALVSGSGEASCPNGHPIDPSWASCPYCALLGDGSLGAAPPGAARPTRLEAEPPPASPPPPPSPPPAGRRTRLEGRGSAEPDTPPSVPSVRPVAPPAAAPEGVRELVAVLAAPALGPGGAVFPVRVGKSFLGSHPANDICLRQDPQVSGEHALLLARGGRFYLSDRMSTNGTWVNGEEVDAGGQTEIRDRDQLRCGTTELVLLVLPAASGGSRRPSDGGDPW